MGQYPYQNRQINTGGNPSYIILEKEPIIYNYNAGDFGGFKYNEGFLAYFDKGIVPLFVLYNY